MSTLIPAVSSVVAQTVSPSQQATQPRDATSQPHSLQPAALSQAAAQSAESKLANKTTPQIPKRVEKTFDSQAERRRASRDAPAEEAEEENVQSTPPPPGRGRLRTIA